MGVNLNVGYLIPNDFFFLIPENRKYTVDEDDQIAARPGSDMRADRARLGILHNGYQLAKIHE